MQTPATTNARDEEIALALPLLGQKHLARMLYHPRMTPAGKRVLSRILSPLGYPIPPDAPPHTTDEEILATFEILGIRRDCVQLAEFVKKMNTATLDPSEEIRASGLYRRLSQNNVIVAVGELPISVEEFVCLFGLWLLTRAKHCGIITDFTYGK